MSIFRRYEVRSINLNGQVFTDVIDRWRRTSTRLAGWWRAGTAVMALRGLRRRVA